MQMKSPQPPCFTARLIGRRAYFGFNDLKQRECQIAKPEGMTEGVLAGNPHF